MNFENSDTPSNCQLLPDLEAGGVERGTVDITRALVKAGAKTFVVSNGGRMMPEILRAGAKHITLPAHRDTRWTKLLNGLKLGRLLKKNNIEVLHFRAMRPAWSAVIAKKIHPVKLVATVYGLNGKSDKELKTFGEMLEKCDHVIAVSNFVADQIRKNFHVAANKLSIVPRGIDMSQFNPAVVKAHRFIDLSKKWRLPDGIPLILVPARIIPERGQAFLIKVLGELKDIPFTCLFLGDSEGDLGHLAELEELIVANGFEGQVRFVGFCDDMPAAYMLADVVLTPTLEPEPFGRVAVEAQAMGRPIVAARHGGARETVIDGETGFLFTPSDPEDLKKKLTRALQMSSDERVTMAEKSRAHVSTHFTLDQMCEQTLKLYRSLKQPNALK